PPPATPATGIPRFRLPAPYAAEPTTWLITFADLLSLILVFFVLIFSANAVQLSAWRILVNSLSDRLNPSLVRAERPDDLPHLTAPMVAGREIAWLETLFTEKLAADPVLRDSRLRHLGDRLAISVPADLLFRRDDDRLADPAAFDALARLAGLLRDLDNRVAVVAYTDPLAA